MYLYENLFIWKFISSPSAKRNILLTKRTKDESIKYAILFVLSFCSFCYLFVCIFCAMPSSEDNKTIPDADLKDNLSFYSFSSIKFCFIRIATRLSEKREEEKNLQTANLITRREIVVKNCPTSNATFRPTHHITCCWWWAVFSASTQNSKSHQRLKGLKPHEGITTSWKMRNL